mmetsp:Transcript_3025/g.6385  ORF Transcript_3025/g.6385 Transcript_3025/m.6385 type:complete len:207 (-) Transcript_3025:204-824(-)
MLRMPSPLATFSLASLALPFPLFFFLLFFLQSSSLPPRRGRQHRNVDRHRRGVGIASRFHRAGGGELSTDLSDRRPERMGKGGPSPGGHRGHGTERGGISIGDGQAQFRGESGGDGPALFELHLRDVTERIFHRLPPPSRRSTRGTQSRRRRARTPCPSGCHALSARGRNRLCGDGIAAGREIESRLEGGVGSFGFERFDSLQGEL